MGVEWMDVENAIDQCMSAYCTFLQSLTRIYIYNREGKGEEGRVELHLVRV